jgi:hypothetical protein
MTHKVNILSIPVDETIQITISGAYYERLNKLIIDFGDTKPPKELLKAIELMKSNQAHTDTFAFNFETLLILLREVETTFHKQGKAISTPIDFEIPEELKQQLNQKED